MLKTTATVSTAVLLLASDILGSGLKASPAEGLAARPNVIVINIDDLSPAWLPPYAKRLKPDDVEEVICKIYAKNRASEGTFSLPKHLDAACHSTPFLDSIAQQGAVFDWCFASASISAPSRAGLLTGKYQQRWGGFSIDDILKTGIPKDVPCLVESFKEAGYRCGMIGKWHVGIRDQALWKQAEAQVRAAGEMKPKWKTISEVADKLGYDSSCGPGQSPLDRGFDYYFGYNKHDSRYYEASDLWENKDRVSKRPVGEFLTDLFNDKSAEFVEQALKQDKRFFLYYAPMTVHGFLVPPPEKYSSQFHTGIPYTDQFAGHLLALDEGIRKLYDILKAHHQDQNTLFMLTADNGQAADIPPYNAPFRGGKGTGWLGGSHEPLIIFWPGHVRPGVRNQLVSTLDILPTALDAAGLAPSKSVDGRSLLPLLEDKTTASPHDMLFSACLHSTAWTYSYFSDWKVMVNWKVDVELLDKKRINDMGTCPLYVWGLKKDSLFMIVSKTMPELYTAFPEGRPARHLYFDLKKDIKETVNLYAETPETTLQPGEAAIRDWFAQTQAPASRHGAEYQSLLQTTGVQKMPSLNEASVAPNSYSSDLDVN